MKKLPVVRQSQVVGTFGPGALLDMPTRSVLVGGLDRWRLPQRPEEIHEPALARRLEQLLRDRNQLDQDRVLRLLVPPASTDLQQADAGGIEVTVFPAWFVSELVETPTMNGRERRGRRLVRWVELDTTQRRVWEDETGTKHSVTPIRFVAACERGHLQDIDWRRLLHSGRACLEAMWLLEEGTSASLDALEVACSCGASLPLPELSQPHRLSTCAGHRPWLGADVPEGCDKALRLLTRTATNTYFPQVATVISLPATEDELTQAVVRNLANLSRARSAEMVAMFRMGNQDMDADLKPFEDEEIFACLERLRARPDVSQSAASVSRDFKSHEFELLASGDAVIGTNEAGSLLHAETLQREKWDAAGDPRFATIRSIVAVHRHREVMCLYGFTRLEPAPLDADGFEDIQLAVEGAPIASVHEWLPAVERFGEGIFLQINPEAVERWLDRADVARRIASLAAGFSTHQRKYPSLADARYPGGAYVMLHSLAHALMSEIALDCGYPASSLKERVYALAGDGLRTGRYGLLIYTASTGAQGTLGGLVATAERLIGILGKSLDRLTLCSNDPVCADHEPGASPDERALLGAACHGCLLIAETSCECRNGFLDRNLLVDTVVDAGCGFFSSRS